MDFSRLERLASLCSKRSILFSSSLFLQETLFQIPDFLSAFLDFGLEFRLRLEEEILGLNFRFPLQGLAFFLAPPPPRGVLFGQTDPSRGKLLVEEEADQKPAPEGSTQSDHPKKIFIHGFKPFSSPVNLPRVLRGDLRGKKFNR